MLERAKSKAGEEAALFVADMRELPVFGRFDLVWCLDDAINYLLSTLELEMALKGMRRNLEVDGLLMFDVNTLTVFRSFFAEELVVETGGRRMIWKGLSSPDFKPESIAEAQFSVEPMEGSADPRVPPKLHRERHFPEATVLEALEGAGLECLNVYGHHDDSVPQQPLDEQLHTKAVYIARAAKS